MLSTISHHPHKKMSPHFLNKNVVDSASTLLTEEFKSLKIVEDQNNNYWSKGTGFGTGSTIQQWNIEKTIMQQQIENDHVASILEVK